MDGAAYQSSTYVADPSTSTYSGFVVSCVVAWPANIYNQLASESKFQADIIRVITERVSSAAYVSSPEIQATNTSVYASIAVYFDPSMGTQAADFAGM